MADVINPPDIKIDWEKLIIGKGGKHILCGKCHPIGKFATDITTMCGKTLKPQAPIAVSKTILCELCLLANKDRLPCNACGHINKPVK